MPKNTKIPMKKANKPDWAMGQLSPVLKAQLKGRQSNMNIPVMAVNPPMIRKTALKLIIAQITFLPWE